MIFSKGKFKVILEYIGEGFSGDYDKSDPTDEPLIRFTCYQQDDQLNGASFCTMASITTPKRKLMSFGQNILNILVNTNGKYEQYYAKLQKLSHFGGE